MNRHDIEPRFTSESSRDEDFARLAETTQQALNTVPHVEYRWLRGFVASGTAGTEMPPLRWTGPPPAVCVIERIVPRDGVTQDVGVSSRLNFVPASGGLVMFEPSGLTANAAYDVVVKIVGSAAG